MSEKLNAFAELYGFLPGKGKNDHRWDGGLTYEVNENLQLDISTGIGLSKVSPDFFPSLGLSIRMP
ncbi:transporter [Ancylomarina longa]|uniref:transporter n=1 Tax=Ancylomarina longa TaxID=2487017 RepID=UPI001ADDFF8C|nr:transporter [Ancylomarina longa]